MKRLTRRGFTAAGILTALGAGTALSASCTNPFDPSYNEIEDVYGPPDDYDPDENIQPAVYGPPDNYGPGGGGDGFDPSDNELEDVYGPPADTYDPDDNVVETVYGPPDVDSSEWPPVNP